MKSLTDEQLESHWQYSVIDAYERLEDTDGWLRCGKCGRHPRVWRFDNGQHAKCLCFGLYDAAPARAESIMSVYKRTGLTVDYRRDNLKDAWNKWVETGIDQNKLPEGRW